MILKYLSFLTLSVLFALIFLGGYVSSTGVGLSCPDWPLCPKGVIPSQEFLIEYIHRTTAATTGLLVILTMVFALKSKEVSKEIKIASIIAAGSVVGQITLGGFVIIERLHAILVTVHLALGIVLFSMILIITLHAWNISNNKLKRRADVHNKAPENS
jgi:cytochrome c oxidase assembly protein subunit 15